MFILDTNVVSELLKPEPNAKVLVCLRKMAAAAVYTTAITEAELLYGIETAPVGKRRAELGERVHHMLKVEFAGRILPFDSAAAEAFATVMALLQKQGGDPDDFDAQIAAIAKSRSFLVVTRNVKHFIGSGVNLVNPWTD